MPAAIGWQNSVAGGFFKARHISMSDFIMRKADRPKQSAEYLTAEILAKRMDWWPPEPRFAIDIVKGESDWKAITDSEQPGWSADLAYSIGHVAAQVRQHNAWSGR